jgi:hypothetical protein
MLHIFACSIPLLRHVRGLSLVVSPPFESTAFVYNRLPVLVLAPFQKRVFVCYW